MNIGDRVDDEKERGHDKEDENRNEIKKHISGACARQPLFVCVFVFQDNLPQLQFLSFSDNDPSQSALLRPPIHPTPTSICTHTQTLKQEQILCTPHCTN